MIQSPASASDPIQILLIEDNPGDARLVQELLRGVATANFVLDRVDRLGPALERLKQARIDVVLLDLSLPDSGGHETFTAIHEQAPDVPIIVLTGLNDELVAVRVAREGAQDYLIKGQADGPVLWRSIRYAIERQSARVELRSSEQRWHGIVATALDAVITMDAAGTICDWNPYAQVVLGWPAAAVVGGPAETIIPPQHRPAYHRALAQFLATGEGPMLGKRVEVTALHRDGREIPVEVTVTPIHLAAGWLFCAFVRDISDRQRRDREIAQLNESLEQRVTDRTAALAAANDELEAFTYSVSHDLRAPLRHVSSFVRILVDEFSSTLDPKAQHYLSRIEDGAKRMGNLVDDLLILARLGKQKLQARTTSLAPILERVIAGLKVDAVGRQIDWSVGDLPMVECDPGLMEVVFTNLLSNAVKYTRPRELARIEVGQTVCDGEAVLFVRDNGVGFDMKYADNLFGVFQRLHRAEDFEGTGVGLATVLRIIHKHGWRIWAEAEVDQGAAFFFTFSAPGNERRITPAQEAA